MMSQQPQSCAYSNRDGISRTGIQFRRTLLLVLTMFALALCSAGAVRRDSDRLPTLADITDAAIVAFEYHDHTILVHGALDEHTGLTFIVDTGASTSVLDINVGFTGTHLRDAPVMDLGGQTTAEVVQFQSLSLPGQNEIVTRQNMAFLRMDLSGLERAIGTHIDGILGIPFLAEYVTEFDYSSHVLRFYDGALFGLSRCEPDNRLSFLLDLEALTPGKNMPCLVVSGSVRGHNGRFLLDTGYTGAISIPAPVAREAGLFDGKPAPATSQCIGLTDSVLSRRVTEAGVMLGNIDLRANAATVRYATNGGLEAIGLVGNQFLEGYRIVLDYKRRKLWLEDPID